MTKDNLYGWVFHYNIYTHKWRAAKREFYNDIFSENGSKNVISSGDINTLIEIICKAETSTVKGAHKFVNLYKK